VEKREMATEGTIQSIHFTEDRRGSGEEPERREGEKTGKRKTVTETKEGTLSLTGFSSMLMACCAF
jgi:hypothetical protein